ncbi:MAG: hypothetical protein ACYDBJ_10850 [Aggregatilineales bacterium]
MMFDRSSLPASAHTQLLAEMRDTFGLNVIETDPKGNARPLTDAELSTLHATAQALGETWYGLFRRQPIQLWIDRNPGGGGYANGWLRIGDQGGDVSAIYRIFIHEGTHASNEYRGWPYELQWCSKPGLDWRKVGDTWTHPRQQGAAMQPGNWETLPVDSRDVSTAPGEDLAETVRYFVHSVKNERAYLWPLDQSRPPTYLWDTSPTRFVFVRDVFLQLPSGHPWYKRLSPEIEQRAVQNLGL